MSMPSVEIFCLLEMDCGRARATIKLATAINLKATGLCLTRSRKVPGILANGCSDENCSSVTICRLRHQK